MPPGKSELFLGTLDMLILKTLTLQPMHGYAIGQHIAAMSDGVFKVEQGSLYPALERLLANGWATAKWGSTATKRTARFYTITASGRKHLGASLERYDRAGVAIARVLGRP